MKEIFIEKSKKIHGDKYDYSLVEYVNTKTKINIICKEHGIFEQIPNSHLNGNGCPDCKFLKLKKIFSSNKKEFIKKSKLVHGYKYDYSLVEYVNAKNKVKIICPNHGVFEKIPNNHTSKKQGCPDCSNENKKLNYIKTIEKLKLVHNNKYDYSLNETIDSSIKIKIVCSKHGLFEQKLHEHLNGRGCPTCFFKKITKNKCQFIKESKIIHNNKYDYSHVDYINSNIKIKILCGKHGIFKQLPSSHLRGSGCPKCRSSKGEVKITTFLDSNNIKYEIEKRFENCKYIKELKFDFYLPEYNTIIEYDGIQHFKPFEYFGGNNNFIKIKKRDKIKNDFCLNNNIKLIRISYKDNIDDILKNNI